MHAGPQKKRPSLRRIVYPRACIEVNYTGVWGGSVWSKLHTGYSEVMTRPCCTLDHWNHLCFQRSRSDIRNRAASDARPVEAFTAIPPGVMFKVEHSACEHSTVRLPSNLPISIRFPGTRHKRSRYCHYNLSKAPSWCGHKSNNRVVPRIPDI